jgi:hypothetical protein
MKWKTSFKPLLSMGQLAPLHFGARFGPGYGVLHREEGVVGGDAGEGDGGGAMQVESS